MATTTSSIAPREGVSDREKVIYELQIKRVMAHRLVMGIADGSAFVDGEKIYEARDLKTVMTVSA